MADSFVKWLQSRLNLHGAMPRLSMDGDFGALTRRALIKFQTSEGLDQTGIADAATVAALRNFRNTDSTVSLAPKPDERFPIWLEEMTRRMGLHEVKDNARLSDWLKIGKYLGNPKNLPWCGDAVETCFAKTMLHEPLPSNPFWAQGWARFGRHLDNPATGAVGVIRWSSRSGHVGFVIDWNDTQIKLRGGNQSNAINDRWFPRSKFIAYRWPSTVPFKSYRTVSGKASTAGYISTR